LGGTLHGHLTTKLIRQTIDDTRAFIYLFRGVHDPHAKRLHPFGQMILAAKHHTA